MFSVSSFSLNRYNILLPVAKRFPVDEDSTLLEEYAGNRSTSIEAIASSFEPVANPSKHKWITGVSLCAWISATMLGINLIFTIIAASLASRHPENGSYSPTAVVFKGGCGTVKGWNFALHLIINVLSTGVLAVSNYCMQTLVAPTREEIDEHHQRGQWLDIGTSSLKNLFAINWRRRALWIILILTSTPFHVMYNSMVFGSTSSNSFDVIIGPKDLNSLNVMSLATPAIEKCFASDTTRTNTGSPPSWSQISSEISQGNFQKFDFESCNSFGTMSPGVRLLIMLAEDLTVSDGGNASLRKSLSSYEYGYQSLWGYPFFNQSTGLGSSTQCLNETESFTWISESAGFSPPLKNYTVHHCLTVNIEQECQLLYSPPICIIIAIATAMKVTAIFLAARMGRFRSPPLLTMGDAVASFMSRPDVTTRNLCWISGKDVRSGRWKSSRGADAPVNCRCLSRPKFWLQAPTPMRWLASLAMCFTTLTISIYCLTMAVKPYISHTSWLSLSEFKKIFGNDVPLSGDGFIGINFDMSMLSYVVLANTPQLLVTISYYGYNAVITSMLAADEYSSYGVDRKGLRVTWPTPGNKQRSTYWLSVPYRYSVPMLVTFMILHWMISQAFFYELSVLYDSNGVKISGGEASLLGYSSTFIFLAILVGGVMMLGLGILAFKRFKSVIPLAGSCSAAISAACHPPSDEVMQMTGQDMVKWGETVSPQDGVMDHLDGVEVRDAHCSFTSLDTVRPILTKPYA
ncbi:hypothetical protein N7463_010813 [Penicillium fimorum]|uniref:DUF6536 domain-containing protein n=1 Tax=Penicillium fimorum TaxID=1882269 RepID=A0A9X0C1T0_9EURO|nr:hypothetical protein N7463_010813 [Penicillium fimorum]